jgi:pimeloyl-ACP methyl ester carboxylesterase
LSGIACDEVYWTELAPALASERQVITWDYPHHGESGPAGDPSEIKVESLAKHWRALMDHLAIDSAALIGHSMGVQVMFECYRSFEERVRAMISVAGPYGQVVGHLYGTPVGLYLMTAIDALVKTQPALAQVLWKLAVTPALADPIARLAGLVGPAPTETMARYFRHLAGLELEPLIAMFKAGHDHSAADLLDKIKVPVLILHGTHDVMTPMSLAEEMHRRIRGSELVAVEGGAHTLPAEDHDLIYREVRRFLHKKADKPPSRDPSQDLR